MTTRKPKVSALAKRIEAQLTLKGMLQADLARKSGVGQSMLNHLRGGRVRRVDCVNIFKLADALECDARWLALGD